VLARRVYGGDRAGTLAAVALTTAPLVALLAARAYVDLATALYTVLAIHAFLAWTRELGAARWELSGHADALGQPPAPGSRLSAPGSRLSALGSELPQRRWLILGGTCCGLALATKYAGVYLLLAVGGAVLLRGLRHGLKAAPAQAAWVLAPALVLAAPWYLKNWWWLGNPLFPLLVGGADWPPERVEHFAYLSGHYGQGRTLESFLKLPWHIFTRSVTFGHMPHAYPPLLGLLAPLALLGDTGRGDAGAQLRWLAYFMGAGALLWMAGWQDLRFLLPVYPLLAVLAAGALLRIGEARAIRGQHIAPALTLFALVGVVTSQWAPAADRWPVAVGQEARDTYLARQLYDFGGIQYLNDHVPPHEAVLFLGDGQVFYCRPRCLPDTAHDNAWRWFSVLGRPEATRAGLRDHGVTHILLSRPDIWYLEHLDPLRRIPRQLADFYAFKGQYLDTVYSDWAIDVYRLRD
jgi:4-amino-4-deoxy-L-arabinose transferase-like glycosyltransferase